MLSGYLLDNYDINKQQDSSEAPSSELVEEIKLAECFQILLLALFIFKTSPINQSS
jgi:hypothetical protein